MHCYFCRISWAFAVDVAANDYCFRSSSIEATCTFEVKFLSAVMFDLPRTESAAT